jgi:hypothetical protein
VEENAGQQLDERLTELLYKITEASDEELIELRDLILEQANAYSQNDTAPFELLASLADAADALNNEQKRRADQVKRAHDARNTLARFREQSRSGRAAVPADRRPRFYTGTATAVTAAGVSVPDRDALAHEFAQAIKQQRGPNSRDGRVIVATLHSGSAGRGELRPGDPAEAIIAAIDTAAADHADRLRAALHDAARDPAALTAAGGLGAPEQSDYTLPGFEVTDRPVKVALPTFTADRGGVRFIRPPLITNLNGAIGLWDVEDDIAAMSDPTRRKPSVRVTPGPEVVVNLQAVTSILTFGNLMQRAYPEFITRFNVRPCQRAPFGAFGLGVVGIPRRLKSVHTPYRVSPSRTRRAASFTTAARSGSISSFPPSALRYPNGGNPPWRSSCSRRWRAARATRSEMRSASAASTFALMRATMRPSAVERSSSPDTTVQIRVPVFWCSSMRASSSRGDA